MKVNTTSERVKSIESKVEELRDPPEVPFAAISNADQTYIICACENKVE